MSRGKSVLIAEDHQATMDVYREILKDQGHNVTCVLYNERCRPRIPSGKFDGMIVGSLYGDWEKVVGQVDANKDNIYFLSWDSSNIMEARKKGLNAINERYIDIDKLGRMF